MRYLVAYRDGGASSELLDALHGVAHNIKGQGGSFGYELVTDIGASFCDYLRGGKRVSPDELNIVHMHIRMLKRVSDDDLRATVAKRVRVLSRNSGF